MALRGALVGGCLLSACALLLGCAPGGRAGVARPASPARPPHSPPPPEIRAEDDRATTRSEMRNVRFHSAPGVVLDIRRLSGWTLRTDPARPPFFDDPASFLLRVDYGEFALG